MSNILFLAHRVPFPPNRGDKIRAHHLLKRLARMSTVHVGCLAENREDREAERDLARIAATHLVARRSKPLALAGAEAVLAGKPVSLTAFANRRLAKWVRNTIKRHSVDTIVVFSGQMGQYIPDDFTGRVIVDLCDVDSAKFESYAEAGDRAWINHREGQLLSREEERLAHRADAVSFISANEAELFRSRLCDPAGVAILAFGNGIDTGFYDSSSIAPEPKLDRKSGPHFVFTGQMDYPPNEQAMIWAIRELLPFLRHAHPSAELHVVGRSPTRELLEKGATEGVRIWGEVPDVRPFIAAADFVIAPLLIARGVQNKVLEAMALAKPVLLTPDAAVGIDAVDGEHWLIAPPDPAAMFARVDPFLRDREARSTMGAKARQYVLEHHAWDTMLDPFEALVRGTVAGARHAA